LIWVKHHPTLLPMAQNDQWRNGEKNDSANSETSAVCSRYRHDGQPQRPFSSLLMNVSKWA
jgi:hypothetical protein